MPWQMVGVAVAGFVSVWARNKQFQATEERKSTSICSAQYISHTLSIIVLIFGFRYMYVRLLIMQ